MRRICLSLIVAVTICAAIAKLGPRESLAGPNPGKLILGVDTQELLTLMGAGKPLSVNIDNGGVDYRIPLLRLGPVKDPRAKHNSVLSIGVFQTVELAQKEFLRSATSRTVAPTRLSEKMPGDEFAFWFGPHYRGGKQVGTGGNCLLRRRNLVLTFDVDGDMRPMLDLAWRIDKALKTSATLAPRGDSIQLPAIDFSAPAVAHINQVFTAKFRSSWPIRLDTYTGSDSSDLFESGYANFVAGSKPGSSEIPVLLATDSNVLFHRSFPVKIITEKSYQAAQQTKAWTWPLERLYFVPSRTPTWGQIKMGERELLIPNAGISGEVTDFQEASRVTDELFAEWRKIVAPAWLPEREMVHLAYKEGSDKKKFVAYATYTRGIHKVIIHGTLNEGLYLYIDEPATLPAGRQPLKISEVISPAAHTSGKDGSASSLGEISSRVIRRYRATDSSGLFEPVRILWTQVGPSIGKDEGLYLNLPPA